MLTTLVLLAALSADRDFVPAPEFLERWVTMPAATPAERLEREQVRRQWAQAVRRQRSVEMAMIRKQRVRAYFLRQEASNQAAAAALNSLQPKGYWYIP